MKTKYLYLLLCLCPVLLSCENGSSQSEPINNTDSSTVDSSSSTSESSNKDVSSSQTSSSDTNSSANSESSSSSIDSSSSSSQGSSSSSTSEQTFLEGTINDYKLYGGSFSSNDTIKATLDNTILLAKNTKLDKGSITCEVTPNVVNSDTGIVFNVNRNSKNSFWEDGVSYYFFFISQAGSAYLGKTVNNNWQVCNEKAIEGFSVSKTYKIKVSIDSTNSEYDIINCFVNDKYYFSYKDRNKIENGGEYGIRIGRTDSECSKLVVEKTFYEEERNMIKNTDYYIAQGNCSYLKASGKLATSSENTIIYKEDNIECGSIEAEMKLTRNVGCNGIIFNLQNNDNHTFWENSISYYFFFIDEVGYARLAKIDNGKWTDVVISKIITGFVLNSTYKLKIEKDSKVISCYIDGEKYIDYVDTNQGNGMYYGFRAQNGGISFTNVSTKINEATNYVTPTDYNVITGELVTSEGKPIIVSKENTIALNNTKTFATGTISGQLVENNPDSLCGFVFRSNDNASSYYKFVIKGNYAKFSKVVNNITVYQTNDKFITASHSSGSTEDMYVSIDGNTIRCYIRGILYVKYTDESLLNGTKFGYCSSKESSAFKEINVSDIAKKDKAKTLIFGHSYMELWRNWETNFADYDDVVNIGIGGSVASQWVDLKNEICDYEAETAIFMIGINDLTKYEIGGQWVNIDCETIDFEVREILDYIEAYCPSIQKLALVSCNRNPAREYQNIPTDIAELNTLYRAIASEYDWVYYADIDNAFLEGGAPANKYFIDGLHPTDEAYLTIKEAIDEALGKGEK